MDEIITPRVREILEQRNAAWYAARKAGLSFTAIALSDTLNPDKYTPQGIVLAVKKHAQRHNLIIPGLLGGDLE